MSGSAHASSFVVLGAMKEKVGPSMLVLGENAPSIASLPDASASKPPSAEPPRTEATLSYPVPGGDDDMFVRISPSIIAMESPTPAVSNEQLASITPDPPKPSPRPSSTPMVIRGGIVGDAFGRSLSTPASTVQPTQVATQDAPAGVAQGAPTGSKDNPIRQPKAPEPSAPAAIPLPEPARLPN